MAALVRSRRAPFLLLTVAAALALPNDQPASAAEAATRIYLLGSKTAMAGFVPPPGTYVQSLTYYYKGDTADLIAFADRLTVGLDASALLDLGVITWIAPRKVLGGSIGFGVFVPYGRKQAEANLELSLLRAPIDLDVKDSETAFADIVGSAIIGWHAGNWHWKLQCPGQRTDGLLATSPLDQYRLQPLGFRCIRRRHLAGPQIRHRSIGIGGPHLQPREACQRLSDRHRVASRVRADAPHRQGLLVRPRRVSLPADHQRQRAGARLGDFKGRVSAVGPMLTYSVTVDKPRSVPPSAGCTSSM